MKTGLGRGIWALALALLASLALAAPAFAVLSGTNGRIALISGRDGGDAQAKLYLRTTIGSIGGGALGPTLTTTGGVQHRHPTWSPDRTKVAYARGTPGSPTTENFDIYIHDLTDNTITPITTVDNISSDRPAWSPDGTTIAWEHQPAAASADRYILSYDVATGATSNLTTAAGPVEGKPAWSPDSQTIYYHSGDTAVNADILRQLAVSGAMASLAVPDSSISEFQPSISPDGTKICYTLGTGFNGTTDVLVGPLTTPPTGGTVLTTDNVGANAEHGDYNCTWSPDGARIAYVRGTFGTGALVAERSDLTDLTPAILEDSPGVFDGNPDWAPDGRPECPDKAVETPFNTAITISLECTDTGPAYERTPVLESIANDGQPQRGLLDPVEQGDPTTVKYTPIAGFAGTDSFEYIGRDDFAFGTDRGTVTITVAEEVNDGNGDGNGNGKDLVAPELVLSGKRKQKLDGAVELKARCDEACAVLATGKLIIKPKRRGAKRTFKLKRASADLPAAERRTLKLKVSKKARRAAKRALKRGKKVQAKLKATATDAAGNATTKKRSVALKRRTPR